MSTNKEAWGSRIGLILAMSGNAVGLGNFLRFPVQAVQNGGGAFIIPYLVCFLLMGIPLLFVEWSIGRYGGRFGHHTTPFTLEKMGGNKVWRYVGVFGIFSNIAIAAYYCYIESWTLSYTMHSALGSFKGLDQHGVADFFSNYLDLSTTTTGIPYEAVVFFLVCMFLNTWVLSRGIAGGVEKMAKIAMPLLVFFAIFLAIKAITLKAGHENAVNDGWAGLSFLWTPQFDSLTNPKVWLAAAGQIFFTLSLGQGSVQCFASYVKKKDDIALNAMSAGWMNEWVEVVLGASIIIPISIGYLGIDRVIELTNLGGLGLGFRTMPYLFQQWGPILAAMAGIAFFGLLFFAGITSSLAMGTPILSFMQDEFNWSRKNSALVFGGAVTALGLPTVFFFQKGVLDEYDYWAGTVSLVVFAMLEIILFSWIFGIKKGWKEITAGADIRIPGIYKFIIKWITPFILIIVFLGSMVRPVNDDWTKVSLRHWPLHKESIIGQLIHKDIGPNKAYFTDAFYAEFEGTVDSISSMNQKTILQVSSVDQTRSETYILGKKTEPAVKTGDQFQAGDTLYTGKVVNRILYTDLARLLLLSLFLFSSVLVYLAAVKRKKYADRHH
ncbi:MAG TPA: sodium-dependent transporter [Bacteroidales bacterium]|nr:sodium-dependent transporter [Bacteroidales bacterium]HPM92727.1 sodium-dependent transporter [Bacteroidales bacterium]